MLLHVHEINMNITVFGTGYVGLVTGACLAKLGNSIICVDVDQQKINSLQQGKVPFYEPGLNDLVQQMIKKERLSFTTNASKGVDHGEIIFNCVGTPDTGKGSADLRYIFTVAETVGKFAKERKVLVNKSTVPPGTARKCFEIIKKVNPGTKLEVVSNPEFLKEGNAIYDFDHPDKIVIGAQSSYASQKMRKLYMGRTRTYIPLVETNWETAELIKYANNAFLSMKISFINEIANISDLYGANVSTIAQAIGMDYRISPKFLQAGVGYGGSCFSKDIRALYTAAGERGYEASLLKETNLSNERQKLILLPKILESLKQHGGNTISIWGLSFKPKTDDLRESPAILLIKELLKHEVNIRAYDPVAIPGAKTQLGDSITYCSSIESSVMESDGIVLMTEWDEFRNVNFSLLGKRMRHRVIFDGRNIYDPSFIKEEGFVYEGIGRR